MTRVYRSLEHLPRTARVTAIGTFDGVHVGHRAVVERACTVAREEGLRSSILTFDRHPLAQVAAHRQPHLLTPLEEKLALLSAMGPDEVVVVPFTAQMARMEAMDFCRDIVAGALCARVVVVGESFTFGAGGRSGPGDLTAAGKALGFRTVVVPLAVADERPISSTRIRRSLAAGRLEEVRRILGRPPSTHGKVVGGWRRGRTLGVPTANLDVEAGLIFPGRGVYAGRALVDGVWYRTAVNVGHNPTFHEREDTATVRIEAHLIGFNGDLYGKPIRVDFLHKIRDEQRFDTVDQLVDRMRHDIALTARLADPAYDEVGLGPR